MFSELIILIIAYAIPLYVANASPLCVSNFFSKKSFWKKPIDFGLCYRKKRFFGDGKTIIGTISGIFFGTIAGIIFSIIHPLIISIIPNYLFLALVLSIGAVVGDIVESFFKRRIGLKRGERWFIFDQLDFVIGGIFFSQLIYPVRIDIVLILLFSTFFLHSITNLIAYKIGMKKVPW